MDSTIVVPNLIALSQIWVWQIDDGSTAWVVSEKTDFTLDKFSGLTADGVNTIAPIAGAPIAGSAGARWIRGLPVPASIAFFAGAQVRSNALSDSQGFAGIAHNGVGDWTLEFTQALAVNRSLVVCEQFVVSFPAPVLAPFIHLRADATHVQILAADDGDFDITVQALRA